MLTAGTIRVAPALALIKVVVDLGLDPAPILAEAGWSPALLDDPDNPVPFAALGRLVAVAASLTGCEHFGLLVGQKAGPAAIGAVGFAARHAPDVRSALRLLIQHVGHHDRGAVATFTEHGTIATLGYRICHPALPGGDHITDGSLAICFQLMQSLCGPHWRPLETSFTHRRPADPRPYHAQFGERVRFDAEQSTLSFAAHWLDGKIADADPELQRLLLRMVGDKVATREGDLRDEVRHVLTGMIGRGDANQASVARTFGLSSSTLHRRLAALGTSFQDLLDEVRCEIACRLLADSAVPVSQVAIMLDYSEASAFTRSFKRRLGCGPAAWRASKGAATSFSE
jgi:AraC-like DNA-binding protein